MATKQSITIYRGGSYLLEVELLDADGAPMDPTGLDFFYWVGRDRLWRITPVLNLETADLSFTQVDGAWIALIPLPTEVTQELNHDWYYHELYIEDNGQRYVLMQGTVNIVAARAAYDLATS